jgi:hypothetical protein
MAMMMIKNYCIGDDDSDDKHKYGDDLKCMYLYYLTNLKQFFFSVVLF